MPYTGQLYRTSTCTYLSWFSKNIPKPFPIPHVKRSLHVVFGGQSSLLLSPSHLPPSPPLPSPPLPSLPPSLPPSGVIDSRRSSQQVLDHLPVERERGITVKTQTASMVYCWQGHQFLLNLIDTPVGPHVLLPSIYSQLNPW